MKRFALSIALLVVPLVSAPAHALELRIRAEAKLEVSVTGAGTIAQVAGTLRDDLGHGLPQREVLVQIDARQTGQTLVSRKIHTDARGRFGVQEELPPGNYEVFVRFDKTDHLDGIADSRSVRLDPAPVDVRVYGPGFVYGRGNSAWLSARANAGPTPYQGWADVFVGATSVGRMSLDASGRGTFDVAPHLVVGVNEVKVRTPGSAYRDESEASVEMRFAKSVVVEATIDARLQRLQRGIAVSGLVRDSEGPIPGARIMARVESVTLYDPSDEARAFSVSTMTDKAGRFSAFVPATKLADGVWKGTADFVPPLGERVSVEAGTTDVDTRAYRWAVNGFGITAILFGLLALLVRVAQSLRDRLRLWRAQRERAAREVAAMEEVETIVPVFLATDPGASIEISNDDVGGVVWDVWHQVSLDGAKVELRSSGHAEPLKTRTGSTGRFRFIDVPQGKWTLEVRHFGFIRGLLEIEIPHRGRLSNFRVDLVAVPLKIRRLYGSVLEQSVGEDLWGRLSPKEIEDRLDEIWPCEPHEDRREVRDAVAARMRGDADGGGLSAIEALTEVVEESYFSDRVYGEDAFLFARALVLELRSRPPVGEDP